MPRYTYNLEKTVPRYTQSHRSATAPLSVKKSRVPHPKRARFGRLQQSRSDRADFRNSRSSEYNF